MQQPNYNYPQQGLNNMQVNVNLNQQQQQPMYQQPQYNQQGYQQNQQQPMFENEQNRQVKLKDALGKIDPILANVNVGINLDFGLNQRNAEFTQFEYSTTMNCKRCGHVGATNISKRRGEHMLFYFMATCVCCCCMGFLPWICPHFQDTIHSCQKCGSFIARRAPFGYNL